MGSVVKHVTGALTGKSGSSKTTEKSSTTNSNQSWLEQNPQYQQLQNAALAESNNFTMPGYEQAAMSDTEKQALQGLTAGVDTSPYKSAADYLQGYGKSSFEQGNETLQNSVNKLNSISNLSQDDLHGMMQKEYNGDLVKSQLSGLQSDLNDQYNANVQQLNHRASASGNMGSSRAGVAQGVMAGQEQKAYAAGEVQYRTAEESAAQNRLMSYLGLQQSSATSLAGIGQNQVQTGLSEFSQGMGYQTQFNQATTQNQQNALTAQGMLRQYQQQQIDMNRQNSILKQSPALARLSMYNQTLLPMANLSSTGSNTGTGTTSGGGTGGNMLGGLMGMGGSALGSYFGGSTGGQVGGMFGSAFGNSYGS